MAEQLDEGPNVPSARTPAAKEHRAPASRATAFTRLAYYLSSLPTLLLGIRNPAAVVSLMRPGAAERWVTLRGGTRFRVRSLMDVWIIKETNLDRQYERFGVPLEDGWTVLDIGAGLGDFTVFAAGRAPHGIIHAYEPFPGSYRLLGENLEANGVQNVRTFPFAISREDGVTNMNVGGGVAVRYSATRTNERPAKREMAVPCVTLRHALAQLPGGGCDLLKMDCEGAEFEILLDLDPESLGRIKRLCLEYHDAVPPYSHCDLVRMLEGHGWRTRVTPSPVHRELGYLYAEKLGPGI